MNTVVLNNIPFNMNRFDSEVMRTLVCYYSEGRFVLCRDLSYCSYCKFCIYTHPVNSKFTIWQSDATLFIKSAPVRVVCRSLFSIFSPRCSITAFFLKSNPFFTEYVLCCPVILCFSYISNVFIVNWQFLLFIPPLNSMLMSRLLLKPFVRSWPSTTAWTRAAANACSSTPTNLFSWSLNLKSWQSRKIIWTGIVIA